MTVLYIASNERGAGKTALAATLAAELGDKGAKVATVRAAVEQDLKSAVAREKSTADVVIVEGGEDAQSTAKAAAAVDARVLLVVRARPEMDASTLVPWKTALGGRLGGSVVNGVLKYQGSDASGRLVPAMRAAGLNPLGAVPEDRRLLAVTVAESAAHFEGQFLLGEEWAGDRLVEHFMVGGMGLDWGVLYFGIRENKAVIVRGDRPDVQMAALATPTSCLIATNALKPLDYVMNEADATETPVFVVETDTKETMAAVGGLLQKAHFGHPRKIQRYRELLKQHVELTSVLRDIKVAA
ncbi:MAG: hypothetical protein FJ319_11255 [SAR202 cluster bacterium]|nr:hypothetical protein [SAR202 cluster bacterium]